MYVTFTGPVGTTTIFGMLLALRKLGLAGKIHLVGFDASEKMIAGLKEGHIDALVLQDPFTMGEKGVRTVVAHLKGEKLDPVVDTGSTIVDAKNMDTPEIQRLLRPDLDKWLGGG